MTLCVRGAVRLAKPVVSEISRHDEVWDAGVI